MLAGRRGGAVAAGMFDATESGMLVFEKLGGGADPVPAEDVARVLADGRVPVVVLNACQSAAIGKQLETAGATRLLAGGASSVVAMAYSVYAVAVAEFMTAFYERLFAGDRVSDAVTAGRVRPARNALRPSPKGRMPLADWLVPVHHLRRDAHFPSLRTTSWLNWIEAEFTALRYFTLDGTDHPSHAAQEAAIAGHVRWANKRATPKQRFAVGSKIRKPDYLPNVA